MTKDPVDIRSDSKSSSDVDGSGICYSKLCSFGLLVMLSSSHLKNSIYKEKISLNSPYLSKDKCTKGTQLS